MKNLEELEEINKNLYMRLKELEEIETNLKEKIDKNSGINKNPGEAVNITQFNGNYIWYTTSNNCSISPSSNISFIDPLEEIRKQIIDVNKKVEKLCEKIGI